MTDDVLDLDGQPSAPDPSRRRGPGWTRGRTSVVALVLLLVAAAGLTAILRPDPPPEPQVVGLQDGPVEAWTLSAPDDQLFATTVSRDRILVADRPDAADAPPR